MCSNCVWRTCLSKNHHLPPPAMSIARPVMGICDNKLGCMQATCWIQSHTTANKITMSSSPAFLCMICLAHNLNARIVIERMYANAVKTVRPHPRRTGLSDRAGQLEITSNGVVVPPGIALEMTSRSRERIQDCWLANSSLAKVTDYCDKVEQEKKAEWSKSRVEYSEEGGG